ncbi:UNVERIFIED_CONTAM: starch synthase [Acetivibrio alkalicellulosi]
MDQDNKLKILFVSAELTPFAKTGGLADVAGSLPKSLVSMGYDVKIAVPRYQKIETKMKYIADFPIEIAARQTTCIVREGEIDFEYNKRDCKVLVYFIDNYHYFNRKDIYSYFDDADRFAFFCRAVLEMLPKINFKPDVIHCNDWHTGPLCMLLNEKYKEYSFYKDIKTLFTIHNLQYQGNFPKNALALFRLTDEIFVPEKVEFYGMFSFMKAGIVYCDIINTVSENYAKEIQTSQYGCKMDGLLKVRSKDLYGIVNGIDYDIFNPDTDRRLYKNYNIETLNNKKNNKYQLQKELQLPKNDVPIIGLVSRFAEQKGLNFIMDKIDEIIKNDLQLVLLGEGDDYYETGFTELAKKYPDKIAVSIGFNAPLAHRIYAASDFFLMPSRFEPCGLGQLISLRYGAIPIVRSTGGLAETVIDVEKDKERGNGFTYKDFTDEEMVKTINRAINYYNIRKEEWNELVKKAMTIDFSWDKSAKKYALLYEKLVEDKRIP